jgi:hypothetical protein
MERVDVKKEIGVVVLTDGPGWVHTVGMDRFGFPELEVVDLPRFLYVPAAILLNKLADRLLNGKPVANGDVLEVGAALVQLVRSPGREGEPWYDEHAAWRVIDPVGYQQPCSNPNCSDCGPGHGRPS